LVQGTRGFVIDTPVSNTADNDFAQLRQFYDLVDRASRAVVVLKTTK
jgi:hypothetical protein